jgi:hypothetical protein
MTPGDDSDDTVVIDPAELSGHPRVRGPAERHAEPEIAVGKGTREHTPFARTSTAQGYPGAAPPGTARPPADDRNDTTPIPVFGGHGASDSGPVYRDRGPASRPLASGTRELDRERDPVEVLRMWPHSPGARGDQSRPGLVGTPPMGLDTRGDPDARAEHTAPLGAARGSPVPRRVDDKIALAHLALDLYRELEAAHGAHATRPESVVCSNQACESRIDALRAGLIEACLLVQRVVMMPGAAGDVDAQVSDLLDLIDH